jgi:MoxR-like ATPase
MPDKKANAPQPIVKTKGVITKVAYGWDTIEAPIIAFVAAELPFVFQGVHGNAKTTVGKLIGYAYGDNSFRYVDCSKATILSMAGFPDLEKMKKNEQSFIPTNRTLIGTEKFPVKVILLDELTRATKDTQNLFLELIENKTVFGQDTGHRVCIATMNPETYKNTMKLDAALRDRFVAYLPVPDYKESAAEDIESMIKINMAQEVDSKYIETTGKELKAQVDRVRAKYLSLLKDTNIQDRVSGYVAQLYDLSKAKFGNHEDAPYMSGREQAAQLWRAIIALAAYYIEVKKHNQREALVEAAQEAIKYCLVTKHAMESKLVRARLANYKLPMPSL